jgi:Na+/H+ antiporter NhaD/arsenite permease-like protein
MIRHEIARTAVSALSWLRGQRMLPVLALLTLSLALVDARPAADYRRWLDAPSLAALLALLAAAQGIRDSGCVQRFARRLLVHVHTQRALALLLLVLSALSAMVLTNDVSLFLLMPLTLALAEQSSLPRLRVVAFEALAVNAGSALSPIGNPQNLLLWRHSGLSMPGFVAHMAPAVAVMATLLLLAAWWAFPARPLQAAVAPPQRTLLDVRLGIVAGLLLLGLLPLLQFGHAYIGALVAVGALGALRPRLLLRLDWTLLATIALMLLGLGHLAELPAVKALLAALDWHDPLTVYLGGILLSQAISNVPATVGLLHVVPDAMTLAVAVNLGGFGLAIGSLANLIALRIEGSRAVWRVFHAISLPFLLVAALAVWLVCH